MKKLLVAVIALTSVSAFAGKSMIKLDGCFDGQCDNLDFGLSGNDKDVNLGTDNKMKSQTLALNYAYNFTGNFGAGLTYKQKTKTYDGDVTNVGDKSSMVGVDLYYNVDGMWSDSCFFALHYNMTDNKDKDGAGNSDSGNKQTDIVLEYGHRYKLGTLAGLTWNWSPSVSYTMGTTVANDSNVDDVKSTSLMINAANFAVVF